MSFELPEQEIEELRKLQRNVIGRTDYARVTCVLMLALGSSPEFVAKNLGIDVATVYRYKNLYVRGKTSSLLEDRYKGYWGRLDSVQISLLCKELERHIYTTAKSVSEWVKVTFGIMYTSAGMVDLLNRIGFTYKKTTEVPCEANAEDQKAFVQMIKERFIAKKESDIYYYADGTHPTHNTRSTYAWIRKGKRLDQPTVSGRDRININGLLNAHDVTDVILHECPSVNSDSTITLYKAALEKHSDAENIYIISDNARYYRNKKLREWVEGTKIKQIFLPPYSPNLNLIERLWKFLRKTIINTKFYRTKHEFRDAMLIFFNNIASYRQELESLLTLNFRVLNSQSISD